MAEQLDIDSIFKLKVEELKEELDSRGLAKSGSKGELQTRLVSFVEVQLLETTAVDHVVGLNEEAVVEENLESEISQEGLDSSPTGDPNTTDVVAEELDAVAEELNLTEDVPDTPTDVDLPIEEEDTKGDSIVISEAIQEEKKSEPVEEEAKETVVVVVPGEVPSETSETEPCSEASAVPKFCRVTITSPECTNKQKKDDRTKRFGIVTPPETGGGGDKKKARLDRFASPGGNAKETITKEVITEDDKDKIKKRVERFGAVSPGKTNNPKERLESRKERFADPTIKKRQERFGAVSTKSLSITSDMEERKQSRLAKFGAM